MRMLLLLAVIGILTSSVWGITGSSFALQSGGTSVGSSLMLNTNGFIGTYVTLPTAGSVTFTINASGVADVDMPHMNLVVGDSTMGWDVGAASANFQTTFDLSAGTHFVRTEFTNDWLTDRSLTINSLDVTGATLNNVNSNALALAASDTYIANYRRGGATVDLTGIVGLTPGTDVQVRLTNHDFKFGTSIHGFNSNPWLIDNPDPVNDRDAYEYQQFIKEHFNMLVGTNSGKWSQNDPNGTGEDLSFNQQIIDFAEENGMAYRQHAMLWGDQQPQWVSDLVAAATFGDIGAQIALDAAIADRIDYYVRDLADHYVDLDVYNESVHTGVDRIPSLWNYYGPEGISNIFEAVADAVDDAGGNTRLFVNEYNVLQNNSDPVTDDSDPYSNWYREHIETIQNADGDPTDGPVGGVGLQYYIVNGHNASTMQQVLQNLSGLDLPMMLTEFGVQVGYSGSQTDINRVVTEAIRMVFGSPNMEGFMYWSWPQLATGNLQRKSVLVNSDWDLTPLGVVWSALMDSWTTDVTVEVNADGMIDFTGFFGDYEIIVGDDTYNMTLVKGINDYDLGDLIGPLGGGAGTLGLLLGDADGDDDVDIDDLNAVKANFGSIDGGLGDADGDGDVDIHDLIAVKNNFGTEIASLPFIPEPATGGLMSLGALLTMLRRSRRV